MLTKQEQEERRHFIGASEASAVLGLSRWATPLQIWAIKTGEVESPQEESLPMWVGTESEEMVAKRFMLETGKKVHKVNDTIFHKKYPFLACHIDRKVEGEDTILQCKTASAYKYKEWVDDDIPKEYIIQEFHELACTGYKKAIVACLIGNSKFVMKEIIFEEHKKTIEEVTQKEVAFWNNFVIPKIMPTTITANDSDVLYQLYPQTKEGSEIQLDDNAEKIIESLDSMGADLKGLEMQVEAQKNTLKAILGNAEIGITKNWRISWKPQDRKSLDIERIKTEAPEVYQKFVKTSSSRIFRYKNIKAGI